MKRTLLILGTPLLILAALLGVSKWYLIPQLEKWTLNKITTYSNENLPISIRAEQLRLSFFRPSASLEKITIEPKNDLADVSAGMTIDSLKVRVDMFDLISGKLKLSALVIESPRMILKIDPLMESKEPAKELPMDLIFQWAEKIPLQRVYLKNVNLTVQSEKLQFVASTKAGGLLLSNMGKNITAKLAIPDLETSIAHLGQFSGSIDSHLYLTKQSLKVIQTGVRLGQSEANVRGELTNIKDLLLQPTGVLDLSAQVKLNDIHKELLRLKPDLKIPTFDGSLTTDLEIHFKGTDDISGTTEISTEKVIVDKIELGDAKIEGEFKNRTISLSEITVNHPAGQAKLTDSTIYLEKNFSFRSNVKVETLDLQNLFTSLDLKEIPVGMELSGNLPCRGQILNGLSVTCENVNLNANNIWVRSENKPTATAILELNKMDARGRVFVSTETVQYSADIGLGSSLGTSDGEIKFAEGFKINYKTNRLNFSDVKNLANLKFNGFTSIEGSTQGDSSKATFSMKFNARDFIFENFTLGNLIGDLSYKSSHLLVQDIAGTVNRTQYLGDIDVDLGKNQIQGEVNIPSAQIGDIAKIFEQIYLFPLSVGGTGAAKIDFSGPLDLWKMNYRLQSSFKDITLGYETFDNLVANVSATNGHLRTDRVALSKNSSTLVVNGGINPNKEMNLLADGKSWRLEESSAVSKVNSNIVGLLNFSSELKGQITNPQILVKGAVTDTILEDQEIPNSNFALKLDRNSLGGQLSLFGEKVQGEFQIPYTKGAAPLVMKIKTKDWNFSNLLALVGGANLANEYDSFLTSNFDFRSESGDIFKSSGRVSIQNIYLKRGAFNFSNKKPVEIVTDNGLVSIKNFELEGPGTTVLINGDNFTSDDLDIDVNAKMDLRLMQIFLPFLEDLGGPVRASASISGKIVRPQILGSATLNKVFFKISGFPHPIEQLQGDLVFSHTKILVNTIKGNIAGGSVSGDGGILINGLKDLPTSIRLRLDGVTLNVPDKVRTSGSADLLFSGNWFPFTLSGTYQISSAKIEKEFTEDTGSVTGVRQSIYLPKVLKERRFEPILLDLQLILDRNIYIKNSLIDGSVTGSLQVKGTPTSPQILGRISTDKKTNLIFKDKLFEVMTGTIHFTDPNEINPDLYITARSRINEYDITLLAQGPSKSPTIRLTSLPPLAEQDIISLIALGVTSSELDQNVKNQDAQTGFEIGAATLAKPLSRQLESTLGLNLQFTSEFDATRNISVPKVTLSRQVSEKLKASGSRPLGDDTSYDIKLEYQLDGNLTAVGSFENRGTTEENSLQGSRREDINIFGLDLEFKREFK